MFHFLPAPVYGLLVDMAVPVRFEVAPGITLVGDSYGDEAAHPVVLLHGGGQTRHAWGGTARVLGASGFRAIALDLRGHGDSSWAPDADYRLRTFADDLGAIVDQLGQPITVVGASLGGLLSLMAEGESDGPLLASLVLVDVAPRMEREGVTRIISFMTDSVDDGFASLEEAADAIAAFLPHRPRPKDLSGLSKNLRRGDDGRYRWHWDPRFVNRVSGDPSFSKQRLDAAAAALEIPTLLVRGRLSDVLSEEAAAEFRQLVPHCDYVDVADAAHMIAGDRNDVFTSAIVEFLNKKNGRGERRDRRAESS